MAKNSGYLVDLSSIKFDETNDDGTWIQAMPLGTFQHPIHGEIAITPDKVDEYVKNIKTNVRGQDLNIDYDHVEGSAAGWVSDAENRGDNGLWMKVNWTKPALQKLKDKEYRYFSPEFTDEWTNPATKVTHKNVVFGGGITNRPFLKGILPINLSEVLADVTKLNEGGKEMALTPERIKAYAEKLGLGADATEDDVLAELDALEIGVFEEAEDDKSGDTGEAAKIAATELANVKKLAETNAALAPIVKMMEMQQAQLEAQSRQLAESQTALRLSEASGTVKKLNEKANAAGFSLPIPLREQLETNLATLPKQFAEYHATGIEAILDAKLVALGERGHLRAVPGGADGSSNASAFIAEVKKLTDGDKGMQYNDAVAAVAMTRPDLYDGYRSESYAGGE